MLFQGVCYLIASFDGDSGFQETVATHAAHPGLMSVLVAPNAAFVVELIPATFAVAWAARRGAPRLTTAGAVVSLLGFLGGVALLGGVLTPGAPHRAVRAGSKRRRPAGRRMENVSIVLLFTIGVVVGLTLLGIALWCSCVAPAWMGIALALGGLTHPFIPGHVGPRHRPRHRHRASGDSGSAGSGSCGGRGRDAGRWPLAGRPGSPDGGQVIVDLDSTLVTRALGQGAGRSHVQEGVRVLADVRVR